MGTRLISVLLARGYNVVLPRRKLVQHLVNKGKAANQVTEIELNLESNFNTKSIPRVDAIFSLAQERGFREFPNRASETMNVNVASNAKLWEWASQTGVSRLIHASSGGIYGPASLQPIREEYALSVDKQPTFYLATKLCAEIVFQQFAPLFRTTVLIRPFFLYGPSQSHQMFMQRMVECVRNGDEILIDDQGGFRFNPIFVADAAIGFANALELEGHYVVNCAGPTTTSLREMCEVVGRLLAKKPNFRIQNRNVIDLVADISKQSELLGIPPTALEDGLRQTVLIGAQ